MEKIGSRKQRQDYIDAVHKSPVFKNLPPYVYKYFGFCVTHLNWETFREFCSVRYLKREIGFNDILQAKSFYHLFRNGLILARYKRPTRGGQVIGRVYAREIPTSGITAAAEIDQEIKKLCGSISRPKNLYKLYEKASTQMQESVNPNAGKRQPKCRKASTQMQESVNPNVPKKGGTGVNRLTVKQVLTEKEQKKDLYYFKTLKDKRPNEVMPDSDIKPFVCAVSQFEDFGQPQHAQVAELIEKNITAETLHRSAVAFRSVQKKENPKGPYTETDFNALVEMINIEHAKVAKSLN